MRFRRSPTPAQWTMIVLMAIAFLALLLWLIPELVGVFSPEAEDTFSEWVWDLPALAVAAISVVFAVTGGVFIWAAGHFVEGYRRRRQKERNS